MSFSAPTGCKRQVEDTSSMSSEERRSFSVAWKGPYTTLKATEAALEQGDVIETGRVANSWNLERRPAGLGILTITCGSAPTTSGSGSIATVNPLKDIWTCRGVRIDKPIESYCGMTNDNPRRKHIDLWRRESDPSLADSMKYHSESGDIVELTAADQAVVRKIMNGTESVMRFYPQVSRVRTYPSKYTPPGLENLGRIDTPSGYANLPSGYVWLKVQDDVADQASGEHTRTESWIGAESWDTDLYGPNRWPMPYVNAGGVQ